jgi:imidazoleglycerol phosphate dehydratase HisB
MFGAELSQMPRQAETSAAMAMIDDGSAEVRIAASGAPAVLLTAAEGVDLPWMQSLRCEQLSSGAPLQAMLDGLARACGLRLEALIGSLEDPHHTWEGLFRAIGIALYDMYVSAERAEDAMNAAGAKDAGGDTPRQPAADSGWAIEFERPEVVTATRTTAESRVRVRVDSRGFQPTVWKASVSDSICVAGFAALLDVFAREANVALDVEFTAIKLSSSHVVTEDTGLVLGRALKEVMIQRMHRQGINGAGSNMSAAADAAAVRVALSFEGRNSLLIVPIHSSRQQLRSSLIVGHTVGDGLFSEDLDDFFYGVAWGMSANIVVHVHHVSEVDSVWQQMFAGLGAAWRQSSLPNPMRRGVPPGVKATLA